MTIRDEVRAWPVVQRRFAKPIADHPLLGPDVFVAKQLGSQSLIMLGILFGPIAIYTIVFGDKNLSGLREWLVVLGFVVWFLVGMQIQIPISFAFMRKMKLPVWQQIEAKRGPIPEGAIYAGVAYSDSVWYVNGESSWDFGGLVLETDRIWFVGRKSSFALGRGQIASVEIRKHRGSLFRWHARVYVTWRTSNGKLETFSIEPRDVRSVASMNRQAVYIRDSILTMKDTGSIDSSDMPVHSTEMQLVEPAYRKIPTKTKVMGYAFTLCVWLIFIVFVELVCRVLHIRNESSLGGLSGFIVIIFGPLAVMKFHAQNEAERRMKQE